jgi:lysophospholipase L1-like esterase
MERKTNFARLTLLALLTVSVCLNIWQAGTMLAWMRWEAQLRLDPAEESLFRKANAELGPPRPGVVRVVFAGDSDIALWDPLPNVPGCELVNRGAADTSAQLRLRLEQDVLGLRPGVAVLTVGGNDLESLGKLPGQEQEVIAACKENIRAIVDRLRRRGVAVVLLTITPLGRPPLAGRFLWSDATYAAVAEVNETLRGLAGPGVTVLDCDPVLKVNGERNQAYARDWEHLNADGYRALNRLLEPALAAAIEKLRAEAPASDARGRPREPAPALSQDQ